MKKKATYLLVFSLLSCYARAEVSEPFWHESFNGDFPTAWSTGDASGQGINWTSCDNPQVCPPSLYQFVGCADPYFKSSGFDDGYMYIDMYGNDLLNNPIQSYLRTSPIDCTDKDQVFIEFETYIHATYNSPDESAVLRVRSGNGAWTEFTIFPDLNLQVAQSLRSYNAQHVRLDISAAAANKPNVTIEWRWTTLTGVAWMIDEVALFDKNRLYENVVWGQNPLQGDFNGGLNSWNVVNTQFDTCKWVWVDSAMLHLPVEGLKAVALACWPGVENGAALMNASYCSRYGLPTTSSRSDLYSPNINLTSVAAGTKLLLKFNQVAALGNHSIAGLARASVAVSINNGQNYIDTITINPLLPFLQTTCGEVVVPLPIAAAGKPNVRLRFMFASDTHFWMIDDVRVTTAYDHDLEVNEAFYNVAPDFSVPKSQVRPLSLFALVKNAGNLMGSTATAYAEVLNSDNTLVFRDSVEVGPLSPDADWTEVHFPNQFLPASEPDSFHVFYSITSEEEDENPLNDRARWRYQVTENVFSKNEYCAESMGHFFPSESIAYEIGNCYYIPKGSKLKAASLSFAFDGEDKLGDKNAQLTTTLYRWSKDGNHGDVSGDSLANPDEFEPVAYNLYEVTGLESDEVVTVPLFDLDGNAVILEDSTYYFAIVGYLDVVYADDGNPIYFPIAGSEEINYTATFYNSYSEGLPAFVSMLREEGDDAFRANPWTLRRIPFVNLNVSDNVNATVTQVPTNQSLSIAPNPASEFVTLTTVFSNPQQPIRVEIIDLCGRSVKAIETNGGNVGQLSIPVGDLCNGAYTVRVISNDMFFSNQLLIVH